MAKKVRSKRKILSISEVRLRCGGFRGLSGLVRGLGRYCRMDNTFITGFRDVGDKGRFELSFFGLGYEESWIQ